MNGKYEASIMSRN